MERRKREIERVRVESVNGREIERERESKRESEGAKKREKN